MSISPHRIAHDLYRGPKMLADPGDGGVILVNADLQICELTSGASDETRILANPTKPGIRFTLRMKTDGGGAITVTAANGLNVALTTYAVYADAGDSLSMISVSLTSTTYRWETLVRTGAAVATSTATATATSTATTTASATSTATSSTTSSATTSVTKSITSSATQTVTATGSGTKTDSPTATVTSTATDTQTSTSTQTQTPSATSTSTATSSGTSTSTSTATATATQ